MIEHCASSCKGSQLPITIYLLFLKIYEKSLLQNLTIFIFVCHAAGMLRHESKTSIEGCQKVFCPLSAQILLMECPKTSNWHLLGIPVTASSVTVKLLEQNQRESEAPPHFQPSMIISLLFTSLFLIFLVFLLMLLLLLSLLHIFLSVFYIFLLLSSSFIIIF